MRKAVITKIIGALSLLVCMNASATLVYDGSVSESGDWGFLTFDHTGGDLSINALANGWTGGPTGHGIDDIYLSLFVNDGSPLTAFTGALVGANDDAWNSEAYADGSTYGLDSYLSLNLGSGSYLLAISHCCTQFYGNSESWSGIHAPDLDYRLTFSQDVHITGVDGQAVDVSEPASLLLMALGLLGLGIGRRRQAR